MPRCGKERKGKEREGKGREGKERKGKGREGKGREKGKARTLWGLDNGNRRADQSIDADGNHSG